MSFLRHILCNPKKTKIAGPVNFLDTPTLNQKLLCLDPLVYMQPIYAYNTYRYYKNVQYNQTFSLPRVNFKRGGGSRPPGHPHLES
jgi:hypothetical protein